MIILKPCPFCGSEKIGTKTLESPGLKVTVVYCSDCGGQQRSLGSMKDTIKMWNARRGVKTEELNSIKSFIRKADFRIETYRNQLLSLWTAYCLRYDLDLDTVVYDKDLEDLWYTVTNSTSIWNNINDFKNFMAK